MFSHYNIYMLLDGKVGVGLLTCDRVDFFQQSIESIHETHGDVIDTLVVVNDGKQSVSCDLATVLHNKKNQGVGKSKNRAIKHMMDQGCDHLFLMEDDVRFVSNDALSKYVELSSVSGVKHLNFCLHGEDNKINGKPNPKLIVDYKHVKMSLYHNVYGALSYYHRDVIDDIGYMDKRYFNAMEHVDHTMVAIKNNYHPPFRWFADVHQSDLLLAEQDHGHEESKIRNTEGWEKRFLRGVELFYNKHNINVCDPNEVQADKQQVLQFLKQVKP